MGKVQLAHKISSFFYSQPFALYMGQRPSNAEAHEVRGLAWEQSCMTLKLCMYMYGSLYEAHVDEISCEVHLFFIIKKFDES